MTQKSFLIRFSIVVLGYGAMGGMIRYFGILVQMHTDSKLMIGLALSVGSLVAIFANPYIGSRSDRTWNRFGRRRPYILFSVPACAATIALLSFAPTYWALIGGLMCIALFNSFGIMPLYAIIPDSIASDEMGRVISLFMVVAGIGGMVVLAIGGGLWRYNYHLVFIASALFLILFSIPAAISLTEKEPTAEELALTSQPRQSVIEYLRNILGHRSMVIFFAGNFFRQLSYAVAIHFMLLFAKEDLLIGVGVASIAVLIQQVTRMLATPVAGVAADRFPRKILLVSSLFVVSVGTLTGYFLVKDVTTFIFLIVFLGLGEAMMGISAASLIMDLLPKGRSGEFLGLNSIMQAIPSVIGALSGGIISEVMGHYRAFLLIYTAGMVLSALFILRIESPPIPTALNEDQR